MNVEARFERLSSRHARVTIERTHPGRIVLMRADDEQRLELGLAGPGAPRYVIQRATYWDQDWKLERHPDAPTVAVAWDPPWEFAEPLLDWCEGTAARRGFDVLGHLPAGDYLLVRSGVPMRSDELVLGNNVVPCPIDMCGLDLPERLRGAIVGARPGVPPAMDHPLIGVVMANCGEVRDGIDGVLFFEALSPAPGWQGVSPDQDKVLVVPITGALVVDAESAFGGSAAATKVTLGAWEERGAERYAVACAGDSGDRIVRSRGRH